MEERKLTGYPSIDRPWLKYYSEEAINAKLPECTIYEYLISRNALRKSAIALNYFGRTFTFAQLFDDIDLAAAAFMDVGVKAGDIVSICMPNTPEGVIAFYAINKLGAIACMLNPMSSENEIAQELHEVHSKVLVMIDLCCGKFKNAVMKSEVSTVVVVSPGNSMPFALRMGYALTKGRGRGNKPDEYMSWNAFVKRGGRNKPASAKGTAETRAVMLYTGGTTGEPKGVVLSNLNFNALVLQHEPPSRVDEDYCSSVGDRLWPIVPMFYGYGLCSGVHVTLCFGMTVLLIPQPDVNRIYETVKKYRPNHIFGIPSYFEAMALEPRFDRLRLPFLKYVVAGGDSLRVASENRINDFLREHGARVKLIKGYGMSKMVSAATLSMPDCNEVGSVGIPMLKTIVKIVQPGTDTELSYYEDGEICFSAPTVMLGYYQNKSATDALLRRHEDGLVWAHTGDLGYVTKDGVLYHRGRLKRIVITYEGREKTPQKLYPDLVESVIASHPLVMSCAVIALPHPQTVNAAKAYVILQDGVEQSDALTAELNAFCGENLPSYSVPYQYAYVKEFPRTNAGKVDYRSLEQLPQ